MAAQLTIAADGDPLEQAAWESFAAKLFPSYETFWTRRVAPLTGRVDDRSKVHFRTAAEIKADGFSDADVAIAQLHYTLLKHLFHAHALVARADECSQPELFAKRTFGEGELLESFVRLSGVSDITDELLARFTRLGTYDPWSEVDGQRARRDWRSHVGSDALADIRAYRNRLVHGRLVPHQNVPVADSFGVILGRVFHVPRIATVDRHLDWRELLHADSERVHSDFAEASQVVRDAWLRAIEYVESSWSKYLVPLT